MAVDAPLAMTGGGGLGGGVLVELLKAVKGGRVSSCSSSFLISCFTSSFMTLRPTSLTTLLPLLSVDTEMVPLKLERTMQVSPWAVT